MKEDTALIGLGLAVAGVVVLSVLLKLFKLALVCGLIAAGIYGVLFLTGVV